MVCSKIKCSLVVGMALVIGVIGMSVTSNQRDFANMSNEEILAVPTAELAELPLEDLMKLTDRFEMKSAVFSLSNEEILKVSTAELADLSFEELIQIADRFELPTYEYCKNLTAEELINTPAAYLAGLSLEELMTITDKIDLSDDQKSL